MSLITRIEYMKYFSNAEKSIAAYIILNGNAILSLSGKELAKATYTSPSAVVRFCKKLGCKGFNEFKAIYAKENLPDPIPGSSVDANFPFQNEDTIQTITSQLALLEKESVEHTIRLLDFQKFTRAGDVIDASSNTFLFGVAESISYALNFQYNMLRIGKNVIINHISGNEDILSCNMKKKDCAILLYMEENPCIVNIARILRHRGIRSIAVTSIENNALRRLTNYHIPVISTERPSLKIAPFSTGISFQFILNLIYCYIFSKKYKENCEYKLKNDQLTEVTNKDKTI